jgi:hypothetical protein
MPARRLLDQRRTSRQAVQATIPRCANGRPPGSPQVPGQRLQAASIAYGSCRHFSDAYGGATKPWRQQTNHQGMGGGATTRGTT